MIAIKKMQHDSDSFGDDYWLYRDDAGDGLWRVIPWDKNLTFGRRWWSGHSTVSDFFYYHGDITAQFENPLFSRTIETYRDRIDGRLAELYEEHFTESWFEETIEELAATAKAAHLEPSTPAFSQHPRQHDSEPGWFWWHIDALHEFIGFRRAFLTGARGDSPLSFHGAVTLDDRGRGWITDAEGIVLLRLDGQPDQSFELSVELAERDADDGLRKKWLISNHGSRFTANVTFPYLNRPGETWLPHAETTGRAWELTVAEGEDWYSSRANPLSNEVTARLTFESSAERELEVRYRQ